MDKPAPLSLTHLDRMTDATGLIQHAVYAVPRRSSGYTVDDNARALRLCARLWGDQPEDRMLDRVTTYLSFLEHAQRPSGGFHNLMTYERTWLDADATDDCQGHAARALTEVMALSLPQDYRTLARELLERSISSLETIRSPRAAAHLILAYGRLCDAGYRGEGDVLGRLETVACAAAHHLADRYRQSADLRWRWFESEMTYANAVLPHAMIVAGSRWPDAEFLGIGMESLAFLEHSTIENGTFHPIGNNGWRPREGRKAAYDQQPIEAATMAEACLAAFIQWGDPRHLTPLALACAWFHGRNSENESLTDPSIGSCCDGIQRGRINRNQGAESTLAYLLTHIHHRDARDAERRATIREARPRLGSFTSTSCEAHPPQGKPLAT